MTVLRTQAKRSCLSEVALRPSTFEPPSIRVPERENALAIPALFALKEVPPQSERRHSQIAATAPAFRCHSEPASDGWPIAASAGEESILALKSIFLGAL